MARAQSVAAAGRLGKVLRAGSTMPAALDRGGRGGAYPLTTLRMANDVQTTIPAFRAGSQQPLLDPESGLPALANLSRTAGVAVIAGLLARIADQEGGWADVFVGVHPSTGRPVWASLAESDDVGGDAIVVRSFLGHPADGGTSFLCSVRVDEAEAAWYGGTVMARVHQAAEDVYERALRVAW